MRTTKQNYPFPLVSTILSVLTLGIFLSFLYLMKDATSDYYVYEKLGAPSALAIYQGQYWGVFWNSFLHNRIDFLLINLTGLWLLGAFTERRIGYISFFLLGFFASISTSVAQMTLTDDPGIGLSGVNFVLFFYLFIRGLKDPFFQLRYRYFFLIVILALCMWCYYEHEVNHWNIGIESMLSGMIIGIIIGLIALFPFRLIKIVLYLLIFLTSLTPLFYAPWASEWHVHRAMEAHRKHKREQAEKHYKDALKINPENKNASLNLHYLRIDELSEKAYYFHKIGAYEKARVYYEEIIQIDPENSWAREQLSNLP